MISDKQATMNYTLDNNFRPGTIIVDLDGSKIYTDVIANKKAFNVVKSVTKQETDQLDLIFNYKLRKVKKLLTDMGINFHAFSKKKPKAYTYVVNKGTDQTQHTFTLFIGGKLKKLEDAPSAFIYENGEFGDGISVQFASETGETDRFSMTISYFE